MMITALDQAFAMTKAKPDDESVRSAYYHRLVDTELFVPVSDAVNDSFTPDVFELETGTTVLAFDDPERLAVFFGDGHDFVALPARSLIPLLLDQGLSLLVNAETSSQNLLLPDALAWVQQVIGTMPSQEEAHLADIMAPSAADDRLIRALDRAFGQMPGAAERALLFQSDLGLVVGFVGAAASSEPALAKCVNDAAAFAGAVANCTVVFLTADQAIPIARVALTFDLPKPVAPPTPIAPGSDPQTPPKLR